MSNDTNSALNPRVRTAPYASPSTIQTAPAVLAGWVRFIKSRRQTVNPRTGTRKLLKSLFRSRTKYLVNEAALTPMNASNAPKFNSSAARSKVRNVVPSIAHKPTNRTLFRGMRRLDSMAPKNDLGIALLRPIPYSRRAAPSCEPIPDPTVATRSVTLMRLNSHWPAARPATETYAVSTSGKGWEEGQTSCAA